MFGNNKIDKKYFEIILGTHVEDMLSEKRVLNIPTQLMLSFQSQTITPYSLKAYQPLQYISTQKDTVMNVARQTSCTKSLQKSKELLTSAVSITLLEQERQEFFLGFFLKPQMESL